MMKTILFALTMACVSYTSPLKVICTDMYDNKYDYTFSESRDSISTEICIQSNDMLVNNIEPYCKKTLYAHKSNNTWLHDFNPDLVLGVVDTTKIELIGKEEPKSFVMTCKPIVAKKKKHKK